MANRQYKETIVQTKSYLAVEWPVVLRACATLLFLVTSVSALSFRLQNIEIYANARGLAMAIATDTAYSETYKFTRGKDAEGNPAVLINLPKAYWGGRLKSFGNFPSHSLVRKIALKEDAKAKKLTITVTLSSALKDDPKVRLKSNKIIALFSSEPFTEMVWHSQTEDRQEQTSLDNLRKQAAEKLKSPAMLVDIHLIERGYIQCVIFEFDKQVQARFETPSVGVYILVFQDANNKSVPKKSFLPSYSTLNEIELKQLSQKEGNWLMATLRAFPKMPHKAIAYSEDNRVVFIITTQDGVNAIARWSALKGDMGGYDLATSVSSTTTEESNLTGQTVAHENVSGPQQLQQEKASLNSVPRKKIIVRDNVNLRKHPNSTDTSTIIAQLPIGTVCQQIQIKGKWSQVQCDYGIGWVHNAFFSDSEKVSDSLWNVIEKRRESKQQIATRAADVSSTQGVSSDGEGKSFSSSVQLPQPQEVVYQTSKSLSTNGRITKYTAYGRDPFVPLTSDNRDELPDPQQLTLVGILFDANDKIALLEDVKNGNRAYAMREKERVKNGYVLKIQHNKVIFLLSELGISRTYALELKDKEKTLKK